MTLRSNRPEIIGHAIVDRNGCYADAAGQMPEALKLPEDAHRLQMHLATASICVMGRRTHEAVPNLNRRWRLVLTSQPDRPPEPEVVFLEPAGVIPYLLFHGDRIQRVAVLGGAQVYEMFREHACYDAFHLTVVPDAVVAGGRLLLPGCSGLKEIRDKLKQRTKELKELELA